MLPLILNLPKKESLLRAARHFHSKGDASQIYLYIPNKYAGQNQ